MSLTWLTAPGLLFTSTVGTVIDEALSADGAVNYELISGHLPLGLTLSPQGAITGTVSYVEYDTDSKFVVRASDGSAVRDRTFNATIYRDNHITWSTEGFNVNGSSLKKLLLNRDYVDIQVNANIDHPVTYSIDRNTGRLPFGLSFSSDGRIYGTPKVVLPPTVAESFSFDIVARDEQNEYRQNFILDVINTLSFTVDNTTFTLGDQSVNLIDLGNTGTVTLSALQPVEFINNPTRLGMFLADDRQYIPVTGYDPNPGKGPVTYAALDTLPSGLVVDSRLGYLYGNLSPQTDYSHLYSFRVQATKQDIHDKSQVVSIGTFTLQVVNQFFTNIIWPTSNLGTVIEGITTELSVTAGQKDATWPLNYYLVPPSTLPDGISLSTGTGHLIGAANTSGSFTFTVAASTGTYLPHELTQPVLAHPVSFNQFKMTVSPVSTEYTSIWAKPFLIPTQRQLWNNFISDSTVFLPDVIYRADDPAFGVQTDLRVFLEFGIEQVNLGKYAQALYQNLYQRRLSFGNVKSAIAKDSKGKHIYDAVYVDVVDDQEGAKTSVVINGTTYYPGSIDSIRNSLQSVVLDSGSEIKIDGKHLPKFMTTVAAGQEYGYFKAAVLCYTLPGQSAKIINRIRASKFNFDNLNFFIDRLVVQNSADQTGTAYIVFNKQPIG